MVYLHFSYGFGKIVFTVTIITFGENVFIFEIESDFVRFKFILR